MLIQRRLVPVTILLPANLTGAEAIQEYVCRLSFAAVAVVEAATVDTLTGKSTMAVLLVEELPKAVESAGGVQ